MVCVNAALNPDEKNESFMSSTPDSSVFDELLKKITKKYKLGPDGDSFNVEEKINHMLDFYMPPSIKTKAHMFQWVEENWERYQLISF